MQWSPNLQLSPITTFAYRTTSSPMDTSFPMHTPAKSVTFSPSFTLFPMTALGWTPGCGLGSGLNSLIKRAKASSGFATTICGIDTSTGSITKTAEACVFFNASRYLLCMRKVISPSLAFSKPRAPLISAALSPAKVPDTNEATCSSFIFPPSKFLIK